MLERDRTRGCVLSTSRSLLFTRHCKPGCVVEHEPNHPEDAINVLAPLPTGPAGSVLRSPSRLKVQLSQPVSANQASWLISRVEHSPAEESAAILHQGLLLPQKKK